MPDEMLTCPYNPSHVIIRHRMPYHLVKCKKQHSLTQLVSCPYNAMHVMPQSQMGQHVLDCPDALILEAGK
ncbi:AGAP008624-PA-like protein [Anopheles sinensis]|uniref:AGAP008624-PA-like protein n=1 Tax=Anopheles sinensis TaxID=74873 RepID=A0A084WFX0_ANOSI|nr:AGAP008624-PA-like protein [Anopheles sinensis]